MYIHHLCSPSCFSELRYLAAFSNAGRLKMREGGGSKSAGFGLIFRIFKREVEDKAKSRTF